MPAFATALVQAGDWERAEPLLARWRTGAPRDPLPAAYLGLVHARLGRPAAARVAYDESLALIGGDPAQADLAAWARRQIADLPAD